MNNSQCAHFKMILISNQYLNQYMANIYANDQQLTEYKMFVMYASSSGNSIRKHYGESGMHVCTISLQSAQLMNCH